MDRRAAFFLVAAAVCVGMVAPTPNDFRWLTSALAVTYTLLALGSFLDARSTQRGHRNHP